MISPDIQKRATLLAWLLVAGLMVGFALRTYSRQELCSQSGVDFRGYYAAALVARQEGFGLAYDTHRQHEAQEGLLLACPGAEAPIPVEMPYLPLFVAFFIPFTYLDFSTAYLAWSLLNLGLAALYTFRFAHALGHPPSLLDLPWLISLPLVSNLALGQANILLVACLGEFTLAWLGDKPLRSGLWLAGLLMKPQLLVLLLPGLLLRRMLRPLVGFGLGAAGVVGLSLALGGSQGLLGSLKLMAQFSGSLIQTAPMMLNWRALALNLAQVTPPTIAWAIALAGMLLTSVWVLILWHRVTLDRLEDSLLLLLATLSATFAVTWHAHFYLLLLAVPLWVVLERLGQVSGWLRAAWWLLPPLVFLAAMGIFPPIARPVLGITFLGLNLVTLVWSSLTKKPPTWLPGWAYRCAP